MFHIPAEVFSLSGEAVVLIRGSKIVYSNRHAANILGQDCVGKTAKSVFGPELSNSQASFFAVDVCIANEQYTACVNRCDQYHVLFLHKQSSAADYIGEKFWLSIRDGLMNLGLSLELWRSRLNEFNDAQLKKSVAAMSKSYYRMSRMVANVSHVLDCGSCRIQPVFTEFDLGLYFSQLTDTLSLLYPDISFSLNCPDYILIRADQNMINTAVLNLISNALLHAQGCSHISLSLTETRDSVLISVSDDGFGIEPDHMHWVFCKYQDNTDLSNPGAGFGLTVVRNIARLFGGTLLLESRKDHGTTVRMSLSRNISSGLHSSSEDYSVGMRSILEGLADSLPIECFEEKYMD